MKKAYIIVILVAIILIVLIVLIIAVKTGGFGRTFGGGSTKAVSAAESDVPYASQSSSQVLNVYTPESVTNDVCPVIILVHGGGFAMETQNEGLIQPVIVKALEKGYAVVSVDYRKSSEAVFPAALSDVKAAVRWVRVNAEKYRFNSDAITILGESAGAYLAVMTALTPDVSELDGDVTENAGYSSAVDNVVSFYAPVEFYTMDQEFTALGLSKCANHNKANSFESRFLGQELDEDRDKTYTTYWEVYKDQLPSDFTLKAWIQAGSNDKNVPYTQSENLADRLESIIGVEKIHFNLIEGAGHMDAAFYTDGNLDSVFAFLSD